MKKLVQTLLLILLSCQLSFAQNIDLGINGGVTMFSGDLSPKEFGLYFEDMNLNAGAFLRFQYADWIGLRTGINYGKVSGDDRRGGYVARGLNFQSNIIEASGIFEVSPFVIGYYSSKVVIVPYLAGGVAAFHFNPKISWQGELIELQPLGTEGQGIDGYEEPYKRLQLALPMGGGVKFVFNDTWTLGVELMGRKLFTDYLDDLSDKVLRYGDIRLENGELAAEISYPFLDGPPQDGRTYSRGLGKYPDWYYFMSVTFSYRIQSGERIYSPGLGGAVCPRF